MVRVKTNKIYNGDSVQVLKKIPDESIDLIATDPPYAISFMGHAWDKALPSVDILKECRRVMKPGAFMFVFSSARADCLSRMTARIEEAGFVVSFTPLFWAYLNGFPKAQNIAAVVDKRNGITQDKDADRTEKTYVTPEAKRLAGSYAGYQPKPALEVIIVAMKPLSEKTYVEQALKNGKGISWLDDCRIPLSQHEGEDRFPSNIIVSDGALGNYSQYYTLNNWYQAKLKELPLDVQETFPFLFVKKPGKKEKNKGFTEYTAGSTYNKKCRLCGKWSLKQKHSDIYTCRCEKPEWEEPKGNTHPTVKPIDLFCYLITLGSRENDIVLDPFCGSGSSCIAAKILNRTYIGIELNKKYCEIAETRINAYAAAENQSK